MQMQYQRGTFQKEKLQETITVKARHLKSENKSFLISLDYFKHLAMLYSFYKLSYSLKQFSVNPVIVRITMYQGSLSVRPFSFTHLEILILQRKHKGLFTGLSSNTCRWYSHISITLFWISAHKEWKTAINQH